MNELQNLYEKINPADDPETVAERIIACSKAQKNSVKVCRPRKLAAVASIAAAACITTALIAALPMTASAMHGANIYEVFESYFHTQQLSPVSIVEYHEAIEVNGETTEAEDMIIESAEYTVTVNGFAADRHTLFVFFDVEYKNPLYFENGQLRQEFLEWKPVIFSAKPQASHMYGGGGAGGGRIVSVDGARVSYVTCANWSNSFLTKNDMDEYRVKITCTLYGLDSDGNINPVPKDYDGVIHARIPATKDITLTVNDEVTRPNGIESVLNRIELNSLSVYVYLTTDADRLTYETQGSNIELSAPKLIFKDGTVLDLAEDFDYMRRIAGSGGSQTGNGPVNEYYYYLYDTVIDPESIEAVEIFGKRYTVE